MGKGSKQRPGKGYADGWDRIWGKKKKADHWDDYKNKRGVYADENATFCDKKTAAGLPSL